MTKKILGIDEAGRGPVIGSMYVGGFMTTSKKIKELEELGVKDSKKLSNKKREQINSQLSKSGEIFVEEVTAEEIDSLRKIMTLNEIELKTFAKVIERAQPDKVIMDLPEPNAERFINKIKDEIPEKLQNIEFTAEHGADDTYPIVSAASIIAKSKREEHINKLQQKYGYNFGSGYPHDEPTRNFLKKYLEEKGELPKETRKSWSSAEKILKQNQQQNLEKYNND